MDNQTILARRATIITENKAMQDRVGDAYTDLIESITKVEILIKINKMVIDDLSIAEFYKYKKINEKNSIKILKNIDKLVRRINFSNFTQKLFGINYKQMDRDNNIFTTQVEDGVDTLKKMTNHYDDLYREIQDKLRLLQIQSRSVSPISTQSLSSSRSSSRGFNPASSGSSSPITSHSSSPITSHSASPYDTNFDEELQSGGTKYRKSRRRRFKQATHANRRHAKLSKKYKKQYTKRIH
jgi:hypothetical protein